MIILDTSGVIAAYNRREPEHEAARHTLTRTTEALVVTSLVLAEVDYLATKYLGVAAAMTVLSELERMATVASFTNDDLRAAVLVLERYLDLQPGLTDAANVLIAGRYRTSTILTLDSHYRALRPAHGKAFTLLPG